MASPSDRFRQTISYAVLTGRDSSGKPTLSGVTAAPARLQPMRKLVRTPAGDDAMTSHVMYTAAPMTLNTRVWFPGDSTSDLNLARRPIAINTEVDGAGVTRFYVVYF